MLVVTPALLKSRWVGCPAPGRAIILRRALVCCGKCSLCDLLRLSGTPNVHSALLYIMWRCHKEFMSIMQILGVG